MRTQLVIGTISVLFAFFIRGTAWCIQPESIGSEGRVVDSANFRGTSPAERLVLGMTSDERAIFTTFGKSKSSWVVVDQIMAGQLFRVSSSRINDVLPKTEIPLFETQLSNPVTHTRFHAVLTACLCSKAAPDPQSRLYLFTENTSNVSLLFSKIYSGIPRVILDDLNGDGNPELALEWTDQTGKSGDIDLWTISAKDEASRLTLSSDTQYLLGMRTYFRTLEEAYTGPGLYGIKATASILRNGQPFTREIRFQWEPTKGRYEVTSVTDITEEHTQVKLH